MEKTKLIFLIEPNQIVLLCHEMSHVFTFDEHEIVAGIICNQTKIKNLIQKFLDKNQLNYLPGIVVFANELVQEQLIAPNDLSLDFINRMYVKSNINPSVNYLAVLEPGLFLQYQILFKQIGVYVELFTTLNLLHIKNVLEVDSKSLDDAHNLDELHLIAKSDCANLYLKMIKAIDKIIHF